LISGATLLYVSSTTDTSFLRLNSPAPGGAFYSGWSPGLPVLFATFVGIHNPQGDLQKISAGIITDYSSCIPNGDGTFHCFPTSSSSADHLKVVFGLGITERGSSGSGLWADGSSHYLVGQLRGGNISCATPTAPVYYGRFDVAYNAALSQWLGAPPLILSTTFLPAGEQGAAYQYLLQAEGGVPPYIWSLVSSKKNKLPPGLTLSVDGALTGIPTKAKTTTLGVQVTDAAGTSLARTLHVQVVKSVKLKTKKLSRGRVGTPYAVTLQTTGGIVPLTFSLVGGALPPDLTLDSATGQITGTPTVAGAFDVQVRVASSGGSSDQRSMRLTIK
jgi:hypothetical protein